MFHVNGVAGTEGEASAGLALRFAHPEGVQHRDAIALQLVVEREPVEGLVVEGHRHGADPQPVGELGAADLDLEAVVVGLSAVVAHQHAHGAHRVLVENLGKIAEPDGVKVEGVGDGCHGAVLFALIADGERVGGVLAPPQGRTDVCNHQGRIGAKLQGQRVALPVGGGDNQRRVTDEQVVHDVLHIHFGEVGDAARQRHDGGLAVLNGAFDDYLRLVVRQVHVNLGLARPEKQCRHKHRQNHPNAPPPTLKQTNIYHNSN